MSEGQEGRREYDSIEEFLEKVRADDSLDDDQKFQMEVLARIHQRLGQEGVHPPSVIDMDGMVLQRYLRMAYLASEKEIIDSELNFKPDDLFQTSLLMGIAIGVQLERERNG